MFQVADIVDRAGSFEQQAMEGARRYGEVVEQQRDVFLLALEYSIYCARHPEFRTDPASDLDRLSQVADLIAEHTRKNGIRLPLTPEEMATVITALSQGMGLQKLQNPDSVPDDLLGRVYALLFQLPANT
jgi:hypothetical protein